VLRGVDDHFVGALGGLGAKEIRSGAGGRGEWVAEGSEARLRRRVGTSTA
jgi:hypothetical protein